jgi:sugar O-acyltransferase (sialic acid O-acetyltransferase NeuD family)
MSMTGAKLAVSPTTLFVYGAGGHGKVVCEILISVGLDVAGFVDDGVVKATPLGLKVLGTKEWLIQQSTQSQVTVALGLGDGQIRSVLANQCLSHRIQLITAIHPRATVARSAKLAAGTVVMANAAINADATIGIGSIINTGAIVEHDCTIGDFSHISPNASMGGGSSMGSFSQLGLGAVLLPGIRIGNYSLVGAGAVVTKNIPDGVVAVGVPARILRIR